MVTVLCALFETVRAGAQPLGEQAATNRLGLSAQESAVIRLLAEGRTDDAITKRLGVFPAPPAGRPPT